VDCQPVRTRVLDGAQRAAHLGACFLGSTCRSGRPRDWGKAKTPAETAVMNAGSCPLSGSKPFPIVHVLSDRSLHVFRQVWLFATHRANLI
jgi:hypothetical protein